MGFINLWTGIITHKSLENKCLNENQRVEEGCAIFCKRLYITVNKPGSDHRYIQLELILD
jgi:hypothetical protein